ncbi:MAG: ribosome small subunit-dependent GTPase A [Elusimicrobiota bacterium]|nr:MAG: ribosome small subunit-dependent GTPase A [Elusimicrobiota bacterium]
MGFSLEDWGWDAGWADAFAPDAALKLLPARVAAQQRGLLTVATESGMRPARTTGAMRHKATGTADLPAVGDWIACEANPGEETLTVRRILPRRTKLSRKAAGETLEEQIIAANLDAVVIMTALNADFNLRRLERFLAVVRESGAEPIVALNKADACAEPGPYLGDARTAAGDAAVIAISAKTGDGLAVLERWIKPGRTVGFVGTSGVGKSTLVNRLLGREALKTKETRAGDERGRHTTTHRELFVLDGGGVLLDTPGMREMAFWEADQGFQESFADIETLAEQCRFKDCVHASEPGCAVKAAIESGSIPAARLESMNKLKKEMEFQKRRVDPAAAAETKRQWKSINKSLKKHPKYKR